MGKLDKNAMSRYMLVLSYLKQHPDYYDEMERDRIKYYALKDDTNDIFTRDIMREIYDELGVIPEDKNMYIAFQNEIEKQFGLEGKNIVEVGGGIIPRLGKRLELSNKTGTITVYDPRIGKDVPSTEKLVLVREMFTKKTPIEKADLLIGLMPCQGAEPLIDQAVAHKKDFMLWFCEGGPHGDYYDYYEDEFEWQSSMLYAARSGVRDQQMGKLMVKKLEQFSSYPIIYNQK